MDLGDVIESYQVELPRIPGSGDSATMAFLSRISREIRDKEKVKCERDNHATVIGIDVASASHRMNVTVMSGTGIKSRKCKRRRLLLVT